MRKYFPDTRYFAKKHLLWLLPALLAGCLQPFQPPEISGGGGFLVVDGFLDLGSDTTLIRLSRTQDLAQEDGPPAEAQAQVTIEGDRGTAYRLTEASGGRYLLLNAQPDPAQQYRLRIRTSNGQEYLSEYVPVKATPPIDSVNWQVGGEGVQVYVNTHDPSANTRFYRWEFTETWEFTTPYSYSYLYRAGNKEINEESTSTCWNTVSASNIFLGTSARLSEDVIYQYPLTLLPPSSEKHQIRYSILVKQYGLTEQGYKYWQNLKRNTENLGTLFDPQPSQVSGNIRSVNNPNEPVLGFFSAGSVQEKRIFIARNQLPREWRRITGYESCKIDSIKNNKENEEFLQSAVFPVISEYSGPTGRLEGWLISELYCMDCRRRGVNKRPDFW
jgi:hypothetical protein